MLITREDQTYAAVIFQVINDPQFETIERLDYSKTLYHYLLNERTAFLMKLSRCPCPWTVSLFPKDWSVLVADKKKRRNPHLVIQCGNQVICALNWDQLTQVIYPDRPTKRITVTRRDGGSLWVEGNRGELERSIPIKAFPSVLFLADS